MDGGFLSQAAPNNERKRGAKQQTLVPATVKMCNEAQESPDGDDACVVDGRYSSQVRIVANILDVQQKETRIHYQFEDGTGKIEGTVWPNENDDEMPMLKEKRDRCRVGAHVVVVGALKPFKGVQSLRCYDVRPVEDFNELTHHFLEVCYLHARAKSLPAVKDEPASNWGGAGTTMNNQGAPMDVDAAPANGLTVNQNRLLEHYNVHGTGDEGCQLAAVVQAMAPTMNLNEVHDAVNVLVAEGFLYSTIDEDFHKSTDSG
mmetsp:Transcript_24425/g.75432  ORF Transcript_24425/g.75432 Transcript_24425/m.75432 type:complete len:260 (-) Transcript_24425:285-1064(-)